MLNPLDLRGTAPAELADALPRPVVDGAGPVAAVQQIVTSVRAGGDEALRMFAEQFDGGAPDAFRVEASAIDAAYAGSDRQLQQALEDAAASIEAFHRAQLHEPKRHVHRGMVVEGRRQPVRRVGCYVPGGRATYPSTVLMTALPAQVAGVDEICLCVPPGPDGKIAEVTLAAAHVAGVNEVYALGGAQAIAALAYGTESVPAVDVVAGPGNVYVAIAKREVAGDVGVAAAFAGPSEIVVIADGAAPVDFAAMDIVVQAEHGPGGLAWLVTWDSDMAERVSTRVAEITAASPRRDDIAATLAEGGYAVTVDNADAALAVANAIAPEHLQLMVPDPASMAAEVRNAGAVFCGPFSPASVGDYIAGPSHVLPTNGSARFAGALTVADFCKDIHVITLDQAAIDTVGDAVVTLAEAEGLTAHADSVRMRRSST